MNLILPNIFTRFEVESLIRVGNPFNKSGKFYKDDLNGDGGYVVEKKSLINSKYLISLGRGEDISFEMDFKRINDKIRISTYDGSTSVFLQIKFFVKIFFKLIILQISFNIFINKIKQLLFFMKKECKFYKFFIFPEKFSAPQYKHLLSLNSILKKFKNSVFLKIDIEGSEYRILDEIIKNQNLLEGMVIEFHDIDLHLKKILDFHKKLNLKIIYISPNNVTHVNKSKFPTVLEFSYSKYYLKKMPYKKNFPLKNLQFSNNIKYKKYFIKF